MSEKAAVSIVGMSHRYGQHQALCDLDLEICPGEIFTFLGPNGGGKTTLFRVLSTLIPLQSGDVRILGFDLRRQRRQIQSAIGVVFQAASLDKKLTVVENIRHQAALYGMTGSRLREREAEMLEQLGLADRARQQTEKLSGGLRRRVELAKGMIHRPRLLILDEPSTGLDPGARSDLWEYLLRIRDQWNVTVVMTTHLLEEAEKADRIAILHEGRLVAVDTPAALRSTIGGDSITIETATPEELVHSIKQAFAIDASVVDGKVRLEMADAHSWIARLMDAFRDSIDTLTLGKPTLEDVFIARTGHQFWQERQ